MLKVGLTGGYATGKSCVARELERLGCHVIYADQLGHAVLDREGEAYAETVKTFGPEILDADGSIDRKKLGQIVFGSPELLNTLSGFVHPAVIRLEERMLEEFKAQDSRGIAVVEAAILIETGRDAAFDRIILTVCDEETQIQRGMKRDHLSREQVMARLEKQLPVAEKKARAHYVVDTSGPKEETARQVEHVHRELKELAEGRG
ncbi:MAG: dephospho-CoA kinase [Acidobacteriaceae bacterium]|nr:dephospho-CoA kinase [Acidobacteriaceae bacterium]MBV9781795.1 dephospho-CoA kinase [Acidobacteriaceae bacterium]